MEDDTVTLRDRDSLDQTRIAIAELGSELEGRLAAPWTSPEAGLSYGGGNRTAPSSARVASRLASRPTSERVNSRPFTTKERRIGAG